jgi:hypothetical protein
MEMIMIDKRSIARMPTELGALIALAIGAAALAGCYGPPSCSDFEREERSILTSLSYNSDGSFSVPSRGRFASCWTFCAVEPGVGSVNDCKAPQPSEEGEDVWVIECDVEATECTSAEIIGRIGGGRLPEGFRPAGAGGETLGDYFALAAQLEAVSVPAFQRLARELTAHGAPASLVRAALRAANDEVKHTRMMRAIAREHGVEPTIPRIAPSVVRALEAIAIENAVEGCVGETLGAIVATAQATRAQDRRIRRAMAVVARDETEHAILAWRVHAWSMTRLGGASKARVTSALMDAADALDAGMLTVQSPAVRARAGLPDDAAARAMIAAAQRCLFRRAARLQGPVPASFGTPRGAARGAPPPAIEALI